MSRFLGQQPGLFPGVPAVPLLAEPAPDGVRAVCNKRGFIGWPPVDPASLYRHRGCNYSAPPVEGTRPEGGTHA